jgi:hypothetical protein
MWMHRYSDGATPLPPHASTPMPDSVVTASGQLPLDPPPPPDIPLPEPIEPPKPDPMPIPDPEPAPEPVPLPDPVPPTDCKTVLDPLAVIVEDLITPCPDSATTDPAPANALLTHLVGPAEPPMSSPPEFIPRTHVR